MATASPRMSAHIPTSTCSPANRQHTVPEVQALRSTVEEMDCLAQDGFSEIASLARLALARLEEPDGYGNLEDIANVLKSIWGKAADTENSICHAAGQVGCGYTDQDAARRRNAYLAFARGARHG